MNNEYLENRIKKAFSNAAPDILDSVLADCKNREAERDFAKIKKASFVSKKIAGIGIAAAVVLGAIGISSLYTVNYAVASVVSMDVNPGIEIKVNKKEKVLEVNPLNEDGRIIVGDMDFKGSSLEVAVNALLGSMLRNGYLNDSANTILISVYNDDEVQAENLRGRLMIEVSSMLEKEDFRPALISQTVQADREIEKKAEQYGITNAKAQLISQLMDKNDIYTFEELADISINDLNILSKSSLDSVKFVGKASEKAYIGDAKAKEIALNYAGVLFSDARGLKSELDFDDGIMVYEVEFDYSGTEFEYDIDALTGEVLKNKKEYKDKETYKYSGDSVAEENAKTTALNHAGISAENVRGIDVETDEDDGIIKYEVEFESSGREYSYEVDAESGHILDYDKDDDSDYNDYDDDIDTDDEDDVDEDD